MRKVQSFIDVMEMLADKDICMRIYRKGFNCYAFDLGVASWWLAIYVRLDDSIVFKLFDENMKAKNLTWKGLSIKEKNTIILRFKGLIIPIHVK